MIAPHMGARKAPLSVTKVMNRWYMNPGKKARMAGATKNAAQSHAHRTRESRLPLACRMARTVE